MGLEFLQNPIPTGNHYLTCLVVHWHTLLARMSLFHLGLRVCFVQAAFALEAFVAIIKGNCTTSQLPAVVEKDWDKQ